VLLVTGTRRISIEEDNALLKEEVTVTNDAVHVPPPAHSRALHADSTKVDSSSTVTTVAAADTVAGSQPDGSQQAVPGPLCLDSTRGSTQGSTGGSTRGSTRGAMDAHAGLAGPCPRYLEEEEALVGEIVAGCRPPLLQVSVNVIHLLIDR
jgi:hypothetical protein